MARLLGLGGNWLNAWVRWGFKVLHSRELTWKPKRGPMKTPVPLKGGYMRFHVSLGECMTRITS